MKKIRKIFCLFLSMCCVFSFTSTDVKASSIISPTQTVINNFDEISSIYSNQNGTYIQYLDNGLIAKYIISTPSNISLNSSIYNTTSNTSSSSVILTTRLITSSDVVIWSSKIVGVFKRNGTYVWGSSGTAYFSSDCNSTVSYTKNSYSSAKKTSTSYYYVNSTIETTSYGTYYLKQYVGCTPDGQTVMYDSF